MGGKRSSDGKDRGPDPPPFICQYRQCSGPLMTRAFTAENPAGPETMTEHGDLREDIPVKRKVSPDRMER